MSASKRNWLIGLIVAVLFGALILWVATRRTSVVDELKQSLRAKGEKLTYEELVGEPKIDLDQEKEFVAAAQRLSGASIRPGDWNFGEFVAPGKMVLFCKRRTLSHQISRESGPNTWEEFSKEAERFSDTEDVLRRILKDPAPNISGNHTNVFNLSRTPLVEMRTVAQWFAGRALLSVHERKLDSALENIEMLLGVQRLYQKEPLLVNQMIRVAIGGLGLVTTWQVIQVEGWTDSQLARLQRDWEAVHFSEMVETGLQGERMLQFVAYEAMKTDGGSVLSIGRNVPRNLKDDILGRLWSSLFADADFLFAQSFMQESIENLRGFGTNAPATLIRQRDGARMAAFEKELSAGGPIGGVKHLFSNLIIPNFSKAGETAIRNEVQRNLTVTAIALKRFQLRHGTLPQSLDALVPEFLDKPPIDCMDARSLKYKVMNSGEFLLYSVGENGKDDGGNAALDPSRNGGRRTAVDLFNGYDIVWPTGVEPSDAGKN